MNLIYKKKNRQTDVIVTQQWRKLVRLYSGFAIWALAQNIWLRCDADVCLKVNYTLGLQETHRDIS